MGLYLLLLLTILPLTSSRSSRILEAPTEFSQGPDFVLEPGYPGWVPPKFKRAPEPAQGRFLYYRKNPKVEKYRSAVHELYMRPYNYVSYEMGGSSPAQFSYEYHSPSYSSSYPDTEPSFSSEPDQPYSKPQPEPRDLYPSHEYPEPYSPTPDYYQPTPYQASYPEQRTFSVFQPSFPFSDHFKDFNSHFPSPNTPSNHSPSLPVFHPSPGSLSPQTSYPPPSPGSPSPQTSYPPPSPQTSYPLPIPGSPTPHTSYPLPSPGSPTLQPSYPNPEAHLDHHAVAVVDSEKVQGVLHFYQINGPTSPVLITGNLTGLAPGLHGFHIHQLGDTTQGCKSMGGHFNPFQVSHGAPTDVSRHSGDLGNIKAGYDGVAYIQQEDRFISLNGLNSILGRGVVIHQGEDDLGRGGDTGSQLTGNAGGRVACAVIARSSDV